VPAAAYQRQRNRVRLGRWRLRRGLLRWPAGRAAPRAARTTPHRSGGGA